MRRALLAVPAAAAVVAVVAVLAPDPQGPRDGAAFHATLAGPGAYEGGTYEGTAAVGAGDYHIRFVPSGSSPRMLTVTVEGPTVYFEEDYELVGTLHDTGISEYHTWEYAGRSAVTIPGPQEVAVTVDPHGQTGGAVSVSIVED